MTGPGRDRAGSKRVCGFGFGLAREPQEEQWSVSQQFVGGPKYCIWGGDVRECVFLVKRTFFLLCFTTCLIWEAFARKELRRFFRWPLGGGPATASGAKIVVRARAHTHTHALCPCRAHPPKKSKSIVNDQHKCARVPNNTRACARATHW